MPQFVEYTVLPHLVIHINPYAINIVFHIMDLDSLACSNKYYCNYWLLSIHYEDSLDGIKYIFNNISYLGHTDWYI